MSVVKKNKKIIKEKKEKNVKRKITELLELPREVTLNVPRVTMLGAEIMLIENHKGIVEYDNKRIRINTEIGIIKIDGEKLFIKEITSEDIMVNGNICLIEFVK